MYEVNKPETQFGDEKCPLNPNHYKVQVDDVAPVGSFPWAIIQVYLGYQVRRNDWEAANEYIKLIPGSTDSDSIPTQIGMVDKHGNLTSWQPTQEDMMTCDWELNYMLSFDLILGTGEFGGDVDETKKGRDWGYSGEKFDLGKGELLFGALTQIQNKTDIIEISAFCWEEVKENSVQQLLFWVYSLGKNGYNNTIELFKKSLYVTVDGVIYNLGIPIPRSNGSIDYYSYYAWYQGPETQKMSSVLKQIGQTKRFCFNWK
ncbi:DUF2829 domain-containing protein [Xenorhabdus khoisanae]|uniref:DUF2829 domain-containing protein n=1 Tax=Xenorhabdus khoisanae TaxID=880157 RepID=UPI0032B85A62